MKAKLILIIVFVIVVAFLYKNYGSFKSNIEIQNNGLAMSEEVKDEDYVFDGELPKELVKLNDFSNNDHRTMTVYIFDNNLQEKQEKDKNLLRIVDKNDQTKNEYLFYSDLELLNYLLSKEINLGEYKEKKLTTHDGEIERLFFYYEKTAEGIIYRKYSFNYGDTDYLISVEMSESKKGEYVRLTNELLSTMIPHTMTPEFAKGVLGVLE